MIRVLLLRAHSAADEQGDSAKCCNAAGDPSAAVSAAGTTMICSRSDVANVAASTQVGPTYSRRPFTGGAQTYYRITTRIEGPRNTVRYVQAFVVL